MGPRLTEAEVAAQVEQVVLRQLEDDDLVLPALPAVAGRALELLGTPDFALEDVAALIETDPILAARLARLANSAAFAGAQRIESILECVTRVGANEVRVLLFETAARQVLESRDPRIAELCRGLWEHSLAVAILARGVARVARAPFADAAYLGGLLHDVGKPVVAAMLLEAEHRLVGSRTRSWIVPEAWHELVARAHRAVGLALASRWGLPDEVGRGIQQCAEYETEEPVSLPNAVRLANALAKQAGFYVGQADPDEIESLLFVGRQLFALDDAALESLRLSLPGEVAGRVA